MKEPISNGKSALFILNDWILFVKLKKRGSMDVFRGSNLSVYHVCYSNFHHYSNRRDY